MAVPADIETSEEFRLRVLEALGTAWTTFSLYPDPSNQPAFERLIELLAHDIEPPLVIGIGPGTFLDGEEEIELKREGSGRFARELFLHDIEAMRIHGGATAADMITFFRTVERDDEHIRELGGLPAVLADAGPIGIEVFERGLLVMTDSSGEAEEEEIDFGEEGLSPPAVAAQRGAEPAEVARLLLEEGDDAFDAAMESFLGGLKELHGHAAPYAETASRVTGALRQGADDPWKGFRNFLEAFFYLPRPTQLMVLESILEGTDSEENVFFLDQLSGADLADYIPQLSDQGAEALAAYAAVIGSEEGRPVDDELASIWSAREVASARQAVATRISEVLNSAATDRPAAQELIGMLYQDMSRDQDPFELGVGVIRGLLECEERDERFRRVLRVWTGRVTRMVHDRDWRGGRDLLDAVLQSPPYPAERTVEVQEALERVAGRETLKQILDLEHGSQPSDEAMDLVSSMGTLAVPALVTMLTQEEDGQSRRMLTELLAHAAEPDPHSLDPFLVGQPWFVLRNLATVLGKTGRESAVAGLHQLAAHDDHRVRVEAMRGLVRIQREAAGPALIRLLDDEHERVRQNAVSLIKATQSPELDHELAMRLADGDLPTDVAVVAIRILGDRRTPEAREVLEDLASRRFAFKGTARSLRDTAREVLRGGRQ